MCAIDREDRSVPASCGGVAELQDVSLSDDVFVREELRSAAALSPSTWLVHLLAAPAVRLLRSGVGSALLRVHHRVQGVDGDEHVGGIAKGNDVAICELPF